jgi:hypothetical protein
LFTGLVIFKHADANGIYQIEGNITDSEVTITPGEWLIRPPSFASILMEGTIGASGELVYGVVPICANGAFELHRDDDPEVQGSSAPDPTDPEVEGSSAPDPTEDDIGDEDGGVVIIDQALADIGLVRSVTSLHCNHPINKALAGHRTR